jgi:hypothetical protein
MVCINKTTLVKVRVTINNKGLSKGIRELFSIRIRIEIEGFG